MEGCFFVSWADLESKGVLLVGGAMTYREVFEIEREPIEACLVFLLLSSSVGLVVWLVYGDILYFFVALGVGLQAPALMLLFVLGVFLFVSCQKAMKGVISLWSFCRDYRENKALDRFCRNDFGDLKDE